jgi:hypothetical protein
MVTSLRWDRGGKWGRRGGSSDRQDARPAEAGGVRCGLRVGEEGVWRVGHT